eukprot:IDg6588t1
MLAHKFCFAAWTLMIFLSIATLKPWVALCAGGLQVRAVPQAISVFGPSSGLFRKNVPFHGNFSQAARPLRRITYTFFGLWFSNLYRMEHFYAKIVGVDEKTLSKWKQRYIRLLSDLKLNDLSSRLENKLMKGCFMPVNRTGSHVQKLVLFEKTSNSQKLSGPSIRYEIALTVESFQIVWNVARWGL